MSHQIVECPGCLTKLRVKESQSVIRLACPRCGEQLAIDPPEPIRAPQPPAPKRAAPPGAAQPRPNPPQPKAPARQALPAEPPRATRPTQPVAPKPASQPRTSAPATSSRGSSGTRRPVENQDDEWGTSGYESYGSPAPTRKPEPSFWQKYGLLIGIVGGGGGVLLVLLIGSVVWWKTLATDGANPVVVTIPANTTVDPGTSVHNIPSGIADLGIPAAASPAVVTPPSIASSGSPVPAPNAGNGNGVGNSNAAIAAVSSEDRKLR
ncbi:MAG: hypothetical protein WKF77_19600 [Planctomycetaceae bacterium]